MAGKDQVSIRIRMYRQGLGDCFLLTFRQDGKADFNMMIDCGLLQGTSNGKEIMQRVAADIENTLTVEKTVSGEAKKWLDVVVLTHEHADHISGFIQAQDVFDRIHFGEVWAGWMDDVHHPQYNAVRKRFNKQVTGLKAALTRMTDSQPGLKDTVHSLLHDFFDDDVLGADKKSGGRSPAWDYALKKSVSDAQFYVPGKIVTKPELAGIRFYVLGPPEDYETFTQVDPPKGETYRGEVKSSFALADSFFAAVAGSGEDSEDQFDTELYQPFEEHLRIDPARARQDDFFKLGYGFEKGEANAWRRIDDDWLSAAGGLALNLDTYTNNTCLALAIEFIESGRILLFPGDAQFANWISWQKLNWDISDKNEPSRQVNIVDLLKRTVFYKVGHHGSHNATLKTHGLEMMTHPELAAMIPVDRVKAASKTSRTNPKGWEMPERNLYDRLCERTRGRIIIADENDLSGLQSRCRDETFIEKISFGGASVKDLKDSKKEEPLYVEMIIE